MVDLAPGVDATLQAIVAELTRVSRPELILLFGSRAAGSAREDSDYDLMLVFADGANVGAERAACHEALSNARISADILVRTTSRYAHAQHDPGFLDWLVSREGRVLYATGAVEQRSSSRVRETEEGLDAWIARVGADLTMAQRALDSAPAVPDAACFHAHAAVEKRLKAEIVRSGRFPPRTHDLGDLLDRQRGELRRNRALRRACVVLQGLYPRSRYPHEAMPTEAEAHLALAAATDALANIGHS